MVTKGYRKGVYKWVTLGISDWCPRRVGESVVSTGAAGGAPAGQPLGRRRYASNTNAVWGRDGELCSLPAALWRECSYLVLAARLKPVLSKMKSGLDGGIKDYDLD
jgi:hypothetical protein